MLTVSIGCHEVMEYQSTYSSTISFIRTSDYTVEKTFEGIEQGRSLISYGDTYIIVISADGVLHRIDPESMLVDTSFSIGGPSGTGYGETAVAMNGHLYVKGPGSQMIEINVLNNTVVDQFIPGSMPGAFCASPAENRLYFTDMHDLLIGEIWTGGNIPGWTSPVYESPADIMIEPVEGRKIIVVSSDYSGTIYGIWLDWSSTARLQTYCAGAPCSCVEPAYGDSCFCVACPNWGGEDGSVKFFNGYIENTGSRRENIHGHPIDICSTSDGLHLYVLSKLDSGNSLVSVFEYRSAVPEFLTEIEIDGFPRDFASYAVGEYLLVLTSD
jgi:hypothetical protein